MASSTRTSPHLLFFFLLSLFISFQAIKALNDGRHGNGDKKVKGMFVFGSSLVDNGNNNFIKDTIAKANYSPYGIDFPLGPSGRFTNGDNVIDLLGDRLKLPEYLPVFNDPSTTGMRIVNGVNYASGGSGILDDTGSIAGNVVSLNEQIINFEEVTLVDLERQLGRNMSEELVADSIFVVGSGGNDYTLNYFLFNTSNVSVEAFTSNLTATLSSQLKRLYSRGARKFVLMALYPLGCSPNVRARQPFPNGCNPILNRAARLFNFQLRVLVDFIRPQMPGSILIYVNSYKIIRDIIKDPASKGFMDISHPCCQVRTINEGGNGISCTRGGSTCPNRDVYLYFDGLHPTEAVNRVIVTKAYTSNLITEVYPFNIQRLEKFI